MCRHTVLVLLLVMPPVFQIGAQNPTMSNGARVRLEAPSLSRNPLVGTVAGVDRGVLLLRTDTSLVTIEMASVSRLDLSQGKGSRTSKILETGVAGLVVGVVGGALVGPLVLSSDCRDSTREPGNFGGCLTDLTDGGARVRAAATFGLVGGAVGGLVGAILKTDERWQEVPYGQLRLGLAPKRDGLAFRVSVGF